MSRVRVTCDGNWSAPEIDISGSQESLFSLGKNLLSLNGELYIACPSATTVMSGVCIPGLMFRVEPSGNDRLDVSATEQQLDIRGNAVAIRKLGQSMVNFFDAGARVGAHFHLDYYPENQILNETPCALIFTLRGRE